jgi:hypothetical protein
MGRYVQIETDPLSSDFMKMKMEYAFWSLARNDYYNRFNRKVILEEMKNSTGEITLGDKHFTSKQIRFSRYIFWNKLAPSMAIAFNYASTNDEYDESTGEL